MDLPTVTIAIITVNGVLRPCLEAVLCQDYPRDLLRLIVNELPAKQFSANTCINKYQNCHRNRNTARERALQTDGEYFLFLDDDIVLPKNAISTFACHAAERRFSAPESMERMFPGITRSDRKEVIGGYYPIIGTNRLVCGKWVADNTFYNFRHIQRGLVSTDLVGLGCAYISRDVLEQVQFEAGTDSCCMDPETKQWMLVGECGMFGNRVAELGIPMYMSGEVVCQHLIRPKRTPSVDGARTCDSANRRSSSGVPAVQTPVSVL
jgi:hypothetical protein